MRVLKRSIRTTVLAPQPHHWLGKGVRREIGCSNPFDAFRKGTIRFYEFHDRFQSLLERNEKADRHAVAVPCLNPCMQIFRFPLE